MKIQTLISPPQYTSSAYVCLHTQLGYILVSMLTHSAIFLILGIRFLRAISQILMNHFK